MNQSETDTSNFEIQTPNKLQKFLFYCSGSDIGILLQCPKKEWIEHSNIGLSMLGVSLLAILSVSKAIYLISDNIYISILVGIFWAFLIFILDRGIIITLNKIKSSVFDLKGINKYIPIIPRFIMVILVSFLLSKPLEIWIMEKRVNEELARLSKVANDKFDNEEAVSLKSLNEEISNLLQKKQDRMQEIFKKSSKYSIKIAALNEEKNSDTLIKQSINNYNQILKTYPKKGYKSVLVNGIPTQETFFFYDKFYHEKKTELDILKIREVTINKKIDTLTSEKDEIEKQLIAEQGSIAKSFDTSVEKLKDKIKELKDTYNIRKAEWEKVHLDSSDILSKTVALSNIISNNSLALILSIVLTLVIMLLDLSPVLLKFNTPLGNYDIINKTQNYKILKEEEYKRETIDEEINVLRKNRPTISQLKGEIEIKTERLKAEKQLEANKDLLEEIVDKQLNLTQIYLDAWYEAEKNNAKKYASQNSKK